MKILVEIKDDLFGADFGRTLNSHLHKRPSSKYNSNPLKKGSLRKCPYSHIGYWEEFKYAISSNAIEGELSHLEAIPILSPSMSTLDVLSKPIFQPILDPKDPFYALSQSHDDPRNPLRQPKHRNHEGHKDDQNEQQQWLECIKNLFAVAKQWMDKDEALWIESKLGLDPNSELKSISLINMTHPSGYGGHASPHVG